MAKTNSRRGGAQYTARKSALPDIQSRIIQAAYACFSKYGIPKTTIEDISGLAGLSRPTFYKYFSGKDALVDHITMLEFRAMNAEIRRVMKRSPNVADTLTECLLVSTRVAHDNPYVRRVLEALEAPSRSVQPGSSVHAAQRERFGSLIETALAAGELASDLSVDEIVSWLMLVQVLLIVKVEAVAISDDDLRAFIRRFMVSPLLPSADGARRSLSAPA